jgi:hypothetical protein
MISEKNVEKFLSRNLSILNLTGRRVRTVNLDSVSVPSYFSQGIPAGS